MRPLVVACLIVVSGVAAGLAAPGSDAGVSTPGDGCLVVQHGYGVVTLNVVRGIVFGRIGQGFVTVEDTVANDGKTPKVKGATTKTTLVGDRTRYEGESTIRFRASGGSKLTLNALEINLSFVGRGTAVLSAAGFQDLSQPDANLFSYDSASFCEDNFQVFPSRPTRYSISSPDAG